MKAAKWEVHASIFTLCWALISISFSLQKNIIDGIFTSSYLLVFLCVIAPPIFVSSLLWHFSEKKKIALNLEIDKADNAIDAVEKINLIKDKIAPENCPHLDVSVLTAQPVTLRPKTGKCRHCNAKLKIAWVIDTKESVLHDYQFS